ncbi:hypothetical protein NQZ68_017728 [Dissostichus eleginoides]|nr:hypothetical protein NQZ68_017728 [Dissostichus eleginoides]
MASAKHWSQDYGSQVVNRVSSQELSYLGVSLGAVVMRPQKNISALCIFLTTKENMACSDWTELCLLAKLDHA